jgi:hypothetical protein
MRRLYRAGKLAFSEISPQQNYESVDVQGDYLIYRTVVNFAVLKSQLFLDYCSARCRALCVPGKQDNL